MTNRTELKRQLADTRAQMERLEEELERTEEWEPEGGGYLIAEDGEIHDMRDVICSADDEQICRFGVLRATRQQAQSARTLMRIHNRALAYVQEHAPDFDPAKDEAWEIYWESDESEYRPVPTCGVSVIGAVIGPAGVMHKLSADLNSGRVKL